MNQRSNRELWLHAATGALMSTARNTSAGFSTPLRGVFALVAIATLVESSPWTQTSVLAAATSYAGALMWSALAVFGNRPGWPRPLTLVLGIIYLALVVLKITGIAD